MLACIFFHWTTQWHLFQRNSKRHKREKTAPDILYNIRKMITVKRRPQHRTHAHTNTNSDRNKNASSYCTLFKNESEINSREKCGFEGKMVRLLFHLFGNELCNHGFSSKIVLRFSMVRFHTFKRVFFVSHRYSLEKLRGENKLFNYIGPCNRNGIGRERMCVAWIENALNEAHKMPTNGNNVSDGKGKMKRARERNGDSEEMLKRKNYTN